MTSQYSNYFQQQVDFYLPQAKMIIEIDGAQHLDELQKLKDKDRDDFLYKNNIITFRITARSIKNKDAKFYEVMSEIRERIISCEEIVYYKKMLDEINVNETFKIRIKYDVVIRFQLLLLSLLEKGIIKLSDDCWQFALTKEEGEIKDLFKLAYEDLIIWLENLCKLSKLKFKKPNIIINYLTNTNKKGITLDFDMYKRWTDENILDSHVIYIRNDYYDDKDYFSVSIDDAINYDIKIDGQESDIESMLFILKNIFGYDEFNEGQLSIIVNSLARIDTIGILPTGAGKSLCYQFACILQPCISFVVCPITSLIYDQKANLDEFGFTRTNLITGDYSGQEKDTILCNFKANRYLLIWISPERFQNQQFRETLKEINEKSNFAYAVIDEVHCLSEWGHDFRTSYLTLIRTIRNYCPATTLIGLTATASQYVLEDLKKELNVDIYNIKAVTNINRQELNFFVGKTNGLNKYDKLKELFSVLQKKYERNIFELSGANTDCGIIFTVNKGTRNGCIKLAEELQKDLKITVKSYYSDCKNKKLVQDEYIKNKFSLMTATKSFGMGVNKKNIRYTVHYGLPWSIEAFYQEAGRAGRDKKKECQCCIIYDPEDESSTNIINTIFNKNTDAKKIIELSHELKHDLSNLLYLSNLNNPGIDNEFEMMKWVIRTLITDCTYILKCDASHREAEVEKAIHKLSLLGFIKDYTIDGFGNDKKFHIITEKYTEQTVHTALVEYIKRYNAEFSENDTTGRFTKYIDIINDTTLKPYLRYMKTLIQWSYDNIVYSRRQSIKNMMDLCDNYKGSNEFKTYINDYFKFSDATTILDNIVHKPDDVKLWFKVFVNRVKIDEFTFTEQAINKEGAIALLASLNRYIESHKDNTGLNFIYGITCLLCERFTNSDAYERLSDAFKVIEINYSENIDYIINQTLELVKNANTSSKGQFGELLMQRYPHRAKQTYNFLGDYSSLIVALETSKNRLIKIKENIKW